MATFITIVHVFVCLVLMFVVLIQQGKGGGMGSAFGGSASAQVFGGSGAGNLLTRATAICAAIFMITSVALAHEASSQDRLLRRKTEEQAKKNEKGTPREATPPAPGEPNAADAGSALPPDSSDASPGEPAEDNDEQEEQDESN
jgi:preprotein translocase subunit SecG